MLRSIKQSYGNKLGVSDGEIGHIKDFYFDDQNWAVRYVVADTGSWLPGRQVLIPPHACGTFDSAGQILRVNLTRKQIENSPSIESHKPVSRQYEEEYHRYFGWPYYWEGDALLGLSGAPILPLPTNPFPAKPAAMGASGSSHLDAHLRSTQAVTGYHLRAGEEIVGHVCDFMIDDRTWKITQFIIKIGHRLSGRDVQLPTGAISNISYDECTVNVNITKTVVEQSPGYPLAAAAAAN